MKLSDFFDKYSNASKSINANNHMHMIRNNLWIGSIHSRNHLTCNRINVVISILTDFERNLTTYVDIDKSILEYKMELEDAPNAPLIQKLNEFEMIIDREFEKGNCCLVHCMAGQSRSAALVIGYIMRKERLSYDEALTNVKNFRHLVSPNGGFAIQLSNNTSDKVITSTEFVKNLYNI